MDILVRIRQDLIAEAGGKARELSDRLFKESVLAYGVKVPAVNRITKKYLAVAKAEGWDKLQIFDLCDELWASGAMEEGLAACIFSESQAKKYTVEDFGRFEGWVKNHVNNWATCDTLCNHTVGDLVTMYPELVEKLIGWAKSENRWVKRAAAVSLIVPGRKGLFLDEVLQIAGILLVDPDDMVQKGYGWMLKAASMSESFVKGEDEMRNAHTKAVFDFVMKNKAKMPRTALRYAIEKMPAELKKRAMER